MYQVSDKFRLAMNESMRTLSLKAIINGVEKSSEELISIDLEDSINDGEYFTIGETIAKSCNLKMLYDKDIKEGMEVIPYIGLLVDNIFEYIPQGVFYIDSITRDKKVMTLECFDKMYYSDEEYISNLEYPTTSTQIVNEIANKLKFIVNGVIPDVIINAKPLGFSNREMLGYIASFIGSNARFNKEGHLEFKVFDKNSVDSIDGMSFLSFNKDNIMTISGVSCLFGDIDIYAGSNSDNIVKFENPFMTQEQITIVLEHLNGLSFTAGELKYRGNFAYDAGDIITVSDIDNNIYRVLISNNSLSLLGGLTGTINSIGEGKEENVRKEHSFSSKKGLTELNIELGKIQGVIKTVEETTSSIDDSMSAIIEKQTELTQSSEQFKIDINKIINDGVSKISNKSVVVDENGITVGSTQSEFSANIDITGFYVNSFEEQLARYDYRGANMKDLIVTGRAQLGNWRYEKLLVDGDAQTDIHFIEDFNEGGIAYYGITNMDN